MGGLRAEIVTISTVTGKFQYLLAPACELLTRLGDFPPFIL